MNFMFYDISLLILFVIVVSLFLYLKRKNLKKEGLLLLYKTELGIKIINKIGKKYKRLLKVLSYVSVALGYILMGTILYLFGKIVWIYVAHPAIVKEIKIPPVMPLIPYLPQVFKLDFLPPFYFIYWIIILAIIAISHECAHGIFAVYNKVKIKKTGFGFFPFFLPIFLAAFVEPDEKVMKKKSKFSQMSILSAGTFANVVTAIFFFFVLWGFFSFSFVPSGVMFDTYSYSIVNASQITAINGVNVNVPSHEETLGLLKESGMNEIKIGKKNYLISKELFDVPSKKELFEKTKKIVLFDDAPAVRAELEGAITEIDGVKIDDMNKLVQELMKKSPGNGIVIKTKTSDKDLEYKIVLGENPNDEEKAWLGVGFIKKDTGALGKITDIVMVFKEPNIYYEPKSEFSVFVYNLLWWIILISISVALVNMLPVGIFDGGRFFYLTILALTKSEKRAEKTFKVMTYFFLFLVFVLMASWAFSFIR